LTSYATKKEKKKKKEENVKIDKTKMCQATVILALVEAFAHEYDRVIATLTVEAFNNGTEQGYSLTNGCYRVCFAARHGEDNIVVYSGRNRNFGANCGITPNLYRDANFFWSNDSQKAAIWILDFFDYSR
jgi:hypothetical protein